MVWDAYRPLEVQNSLYVNYVNDLRKVKGLSQTEAEKEALSFVNKASDDPKNPSPHHTGGSVDLTIIKFDNSVVERLNTLNQEIDSDDWEISYIAEMERQKFLREHSQPVDMGANFDQADETSTVDYFENRIQKHEQLTSTEIEQAQHRRILQNIMHHVGFSSF